MPADHGVLAGPQPCRPHPDGRMHGVDIHGKHPGQHPFPTTAPNQTVNCRFRDARGESLVTTDEIILQSENGRVPVRSGEGNEVHVADLT